MEFMPLTPHDIEEAPAWMREIPLRADRWRDRHTRSVVAKIEQMPVAAGILWTSRVHGDRYWSRSRSRLTTDGAGWVERRSAT